MNDKNKIDLSIEMYEDLKETLVKAIKNAKAGGVGNAGWENTQLERIERLIEAAELSQGQIAQLLERLQRHTALPGVKTEQEREFTDRYNTLLAQLAGKLGTINQDNQHTHTLIGQAVEALKRTDALPVQEHRHTYTLDINSSKTFLRMFAMLGCIFLQGAFIYRISENNRLLAANDLKYRYVKMRGEIKEKELMELETIFRDEQHTAIRDTVRNQVEWYEEAVRRQAERLEQATVKERKAKKLLDDAEILRQQN